MSSRKKRKYLVREFQKHTDDATVRRFLVSMALRVPRPLPVARTPSVTWFSFSSRSSTGRLSFALALTSNREKQTNVFCVQSVSRSDFDVCTWFMTRETSTMRRPIREYAHTYVMARDLSLRASMEFHDLFLVFLVQRYKTRIFSESRARSCYARHPVQIRIVPPT